MNRRRLLIASALTVAALGVNAKDFVNTAVLAAVAAENGVIHAVETVLVPK